MATTTMSRQTVDRPVKRKKEQRTDIWSGLLRQTREAQARSRTQAIQHRELVVCGGSPDDQRAFVQSLTRPPPAQPPARNQERKQQRPKGELRLSNRYAYGYGHVKLFSPPPQGGAGVQVLGAEAEEVAQVEVHTLPEPTEEYVGTLRRLLAQKETGDHNNADGEMLEEADGEARRPGVCVLLSWKEPWKFLDQLRRWLQVLAKALLQPDVPATDPMDVIKDAQLQITVVVQHTESQEDLFKEGYKEDDFDYISQCLRTAILPLHPLSSLVYTSSSTPPQQPGSALSEGQKVVYSSLGLDLAGLSPKAARSGDSSKKEDLGPKHEFMDRMAIVIPAGWDSVAFIRTLSETFAPEDLLGAWLADLQPPPEPQKLEPTSEEPKPEQANGGAEVYESSPVDDDLPDEPLSPSKLAPSAVRTYETRVEDPQAHKATKPPQVEVTTKPDQKFLGEMREHLQQLEAQDREREASGRSTGVSTTSVSSTGRSVGMPTGETTGALNELGDVSFNVGGVSYDTVSAEAAIERLKRPPTTQSLKSPLSPTGARASTPKPPRSNRDYNEDRWPSADRGTPKEPSSTSTKASSSESKELPIDKLEEYFQSLMRKGGGASRDATPTKGTQG
ncbi:hypothetical protein M409DRAFT_50392 [Zasmidium cellare ATCC 36951]|uniref:Dynein light intermediate chain n=1 Tax=Zasmidium cellare ATCC 36951 TaxID=1080233 RepID=A0A6A6CWZ5_ZASCE|nr:uncharacterized protein M409DRAFT_50392 [Zasmidium cellare ATCC 36951]KAF2171737.1 hypothetical protein M409DRAFT_50392 [Zasmidium cellare ATCC 36951]